GPGQVDELEDAQAGIDPTGGEGVQGPAPGGVDDDHLTRLDLAHEVGADDVQGGRLGGQHPPRVELAQAEGAAGVGTGGADEVGRVHEDEGEGALQAGQHLGQ